MTGLDSGHWFWGTALYLAVLLTVLGKAALISEYVVISRRRPFVLFTDRVAPFKFMDQVYRRCHPRLVRVHDDLSPDLRPRRSRARLLDRIRRTRTPSMDRCGVLFYAPPLTSHLSRARFLLEILSKNVRPPTVPHRARTSKVQHSGLPAAAGAIPKGDQESQGRATDETESWVCV